jgi:peroxiredoxin (alkyl hydroperoxide reductase subunit C)
LAKTRHWSFADTRRDELGLAAQLGILNEDGVALRATFIVDPDNVIQHVTVNNLNVGRNSMEAVRVLDAIQSDSLCPCNRRPGGETL